MAFDRPDESPTRVAQEDAIRAAALALAKTILNNTSANPDQGAALRYVKIAMLIAIDSIGGNA